MPFGQLPSRALCGGCGHLTEIHKNGKCQWDHPPCPCNDVIVNLTHREFDILKVIASGGTVKDAASQLGLSTKTVNAHRLNMGRKFRAKTNLELVLGALRQGTITLDELPDFGIRIGRPT